MLNFLNKATHNVLYTYSVSNIGALISILTNDVLSSLLGEGNISSGGSGGSIGFCEGDGGGEGDIFIGC